MIGSQGPARCRCFEQAQFPQESGWLLVVFSHHIHCGQLISNDRADAVQERSYHEASGGPLSVKPRESFRTSEGSLDQTVVALSLSLFFVFVLTKF